MNLLKLLFCVCLFYPLSGVCDVSPCTQDGFTVYPIENNEIEMASEKVDIVLYPSYAEVEASFIMNNTGKEVEISVGFPDYIPSKTKISNYFKKGDPIWRPGVRDFSVIIVGKNINFPERHDDNRIRHYFSWQQKFPGFKETEIKVKYWVSTHTGCDKRTIIERMKNFSYILWSGAPWKGTIGKAEISVDFSHLKDPAFYSVTPLGFKLSGKKIIWKFENFEPSPFFLPRIRLGYYDLKSVGPKKSYEKMNLKKVSEYDCREVIASIDAVANDKSKSEIERLIILSKLRNSDWRVKKHLFEIANKISDEIANNKKFAGKFEYKSCELLGKAQCVSCWLQMVKTFNKGADGEIEYIVESYLPKVHLSKAVIPLIKWLENNYIKDVYYMETAAGLLTHYPEALVPIIELITKGEMSYERERIFLDIATDLTEYTPPIPGDFRSRMVDSLSNYKYSKIHMKIAKMKLIYFCTGEDKNEFFRKKINFKDPSFAKFADKLYRQLDLSWYADYLAGKIPPEDIVIKKENSDNYTLDFTKQLYIRGKLMEVKGYKNGELVSRDIRDDNNQIWDRYFQERHSL